MCGTLNLAILDGTLQWCCSYRRTNVADFKIVLIKISIIMKFINALHSDGYTQIYFLWAEYFLVHLLIIYKISFFLDEWLKISAILNMKILLFTYSRYVNIYILLYIYSLTLYCTTCHVWHIRKSIILFIMRHEFGHYDSFPWSGTIQRIEQRLFCTCEMAALERKI